MYYPYFVTYMTLGLVISLVVFFWALNNGQFRDQQRARYLPLNDAAEGQKVKVSRFGRCETYALFFLAAAGIAASAAVLIFALYNG
ncbi:MAG: cbb3-type cytochrome oxidase assembly protein CcoS [Desulfobacterales bacterium]|nr:cbb3-type cytochrome oxidase assembly protein CcoS [Desulfobacterales bacterium]